MTSNSALKMPRSEHNRFESGTSNIARPGNSPLQLATVAKSRTSLGTVGRVSENFVSGLSPQDREGCFKFTFDTAYTRRVSNHAKRSRAIMRGQTRSSFKKSSASMSYKYSSTRSFSSGGLGSLTLNMGRPKCWTSMLDSGVLLV